MYDIWFSSGTGNSVIKALEILIQHEVDEAKVIVLSLFTTPEGQDLRVLCSRNLEISAVPKKTKSWVPAYLQVLHQSKIKLILGSLFTTQNDALCTKVVLCKIGLWKAHFDELQELGQLNEGSVRE